MSLDKDTEKDPVTEEPTVHTPADSGVDDPSLADSADTAESIDPAAESAGPVVSDEDLAEAGKVLAEGSGGGSDGPGDGDSGQAGEDDSEESDDGDDEEDGAQMSLLDHLGELRVRLTRSFIAIAVGMVACYGFADKMFDILMQPMVTVFQQRMASKPVLSVGFYDDLRVALTRIMTEQGSKHLDQINLFVDILQKSMIQISQEGHFQYTYPAEAFFAHIKISIVAGLFLVSPYVFAQIWGFIAPGLYSHERKWMVPMAMISAIFFTSGALFGYFVVFPFGFEFFASFSTEGIQFTPKLNEYLSFCLKLLFAFGFVFELPLFIFFLARMGMVSSAGLRKKRKYAILIGFVVAAILTPPDPFTQCLMAGPLIFLYEVGIWVAYFFGKNEKRHIKLKEEAEAAAQAEMDAAAQAATEADQGEPDAEPDEKPEKA
jgi:sec-independent protein translocase protein TatC